MRPGRGRSAALAAAAAITSQTSQSHKRSNTPVAASSGTTTTTTTSTGGGNKSKQCIVRLEKVNKKDEVNEKKSTTVTTTHTTPVTTKAGTITTSNSNTAIRKRSATSTPTPVSSSAVSTPTQQTSSLKKGRKQTITEKPSTASVEKMHVDEDLTDYNLVTARARRTPKPNPKYNREDLVQKYSKTSITSKNFKSDVDDDDDDDDESEHGQDFEDSADEFELNSSDAKEEEIGDTDDEYESPNSKNAKRTKLTPTTLQKGGKGNKSITSVQKSTQIIVGGNKRKLEASKGKQQYIIGIQNKNFQLDYDASDSDMSSSPTPRKLLKNISKTSAPLTSSSSSSALDSHRQSILRPMLQQQQQQLLQKESQKSKPIQILERRKDPTSTSSSSSSSAQQTSTQQQSAIFSTAIKRPPPRNKDDDVQLASAGAASTVDDFETMPTFTIVNINDIINKKSDDILKLDNVANTKNTETQQQIRRKPVQTTTSDKIIVSTSQRAIYPGKRSSTPLNNNVTKTLIRSGDNSKSVSAQPPRILNSVVGKKTRPISPIVSPKDTRKLPLQTQTTKTLPSYNQRQLKENFNRSNTRSGGLISNTPNSASTSTVVTSSNKNSPTTTLTTPSSEPRKLPNGRVVIQRQGNKLVKKITCFETWYVINLQSQTKNEDNLISDDKPKMDIPLVELGNKIKNIDLPQNWNYKVTLQKLLPSQINRPNFIPYTGDINDPSISNDDKIKYQPINIMFRRVNKQPKIRIPYDRAVTFKNQSYFLNIDGRNIRLCNGAPNTVKTIEDIQILLEVVDELSIDSDFVELSTYTP